ncbi:hypothetical protein [Chryseobacterium sp. HR92]|uniref:hypothetical protein n=1 Tax=Chryseobacterium sp. HR92 TaxID=3094839 RepID=UPI00388EBE60|nr:hypothetical protein SFA27_13745 [Chryseobacterium sp. HR92]
MDTELVKLILTTVNIILVPIVGGTLYNSIESFKKRKLKILLESQSLTDKLDQQFITEFIEPSVKETVFYLHTGISTHVSSIDRYIDLKNKLGGNTTWEKINRVKSHVNTTSSGPLLLQKKIEKYSSTLTYYFTILVMTFSILEISLLLFFMNSISKKDFLELLFYILAPLALVYIVAVQAMPAISVNSMIKQLEQQNNEEHQES